MATLSRSRNSGPSRPICRPCSCAPMRILPGMRCSRRWIAQPSPARPAAPSAGAESVQKERCSVGQVRRPDGRCRSRSRSTSGSATGPPRASPGAGALPPVAARSRALKRAPRPAPSPPDLRSGVAVGPASTPAGCKVWRIFPPASISPGCPHPGELPAPNRMAGFRCAPATLFPEPPQTAPGQSLRVPACLPPPSMERESRGRSGRRGGRPRVWAATERR